MSTSHSLYSRIAVPTALCWPDTPAPTRSAPWSSYVLFTASMTLARADAATPPDPHVVRAPSSRSCSFVKASVGSTSMTLGCTCRSGSKTLAKGRRPARVHTVQLKYVSACVCTITPVRPHTLTTGPFPGLSTSTGSADPAGSVQYTWAGVCHTARPQPSHVEPSPEVHTGRGWIYVTSLLSKVRNVLGFNGHSIAPARQVSQVCTRPLVPRTPHAGVGVATTGSNPASRRHGVRSLHVERLWKGSC